jgi:lipopolysaccharide transport system permease protein
MMAHADQGFSTPAISLAAPTQETCSAARLNMATRERQRPKAQRRKAMRSAKPRAQPVDPAEILVIEKRHLGVFSRAIEVWRYRRLIPFFGSEFLEKTYARTKLGWLWVPLRPVLDVSARVLIFGALLQVPSDGVPYFLFFLVGMSIWRFFSRSLMWITRSVELGSKYVKKLYFPRLILPASAFVPSSVEYGIYSVFLAAALIFYRVNDGEWYISLSPDLLLIPASLILVALLAFGIGMFTSIFGTHGRDTRWTLGYVLAFWFFLTPVIYPLSLVPGKYQTLMSLNPMVAPIEMMKQGIIGVGSITVTAMASCIATIAIVLTVGLWYFGRSEAISVDRL